MAIKRTIPFLISLFIFIWPSQLNAGQHNTDNITVKTIKNHISEDGHITNFNWMGTLAKNQPLGYSTAVICFLCKGNNGETLFYLHSNMLSVLDDITVRLHFEIDNNLFKEVSEIEEEIHDYGLVKDNDPQKTPPNVRSNYKDFSDVDKKITFQDVEKLEELAVEYDSNKTKADRLASILKNPKEAKIGDVVYEERFAVIAGSGGVLYPTGTTQKTILRNLTSKELFDRRVEEKATRREMNELFDKITVLSLKYETSPDTMINGILNARYFITQRGYSDELRRAGTITPMENRKNIKSTIWAKSMPRQNGNTQKNTVNTTGQVAPKGYDDSKDATVFNDHEGSTVFNCLPVENIVFE